VKSSELVEILLNVCYEKLEVCSTYSTKKMQLIKVFVEIVYSLEEKY
jgi:hypothetical protein